MVTDEALHKLVRAYGVTGSCSGYRYLVWALKLLREEPGRLELVTKRLYPEVAQRFGVTVSAVEGALRTAMGVCLRKSPERFAALAPAGGAVTVKAFLGFLLEQTEE